MNKSSFNFDDVVVEFNCAQNEVLFPAPLDTVEINDKMTANGFHVESEEPASPLFSDPSFSDDELALLNLEVTDKIEDLMIELAKDKGTYPMPFVEDEIDDSVSVNSSDNFDAERCLENLIPDFDEYFHLSAKLDKAITKFGWAALSEQRDRAWEEFLDSVDLNWQRLDLFDEKADKRLASLLRKGEEPTDEQWNSFKATRHKIYLASEQMKDSRIRMTYPLYQKAKALNAKCAAFWHTVHGQAINAIRTARKEIFDRLSVADDNGRIPWDLVRDYFRLREEEISPYFTTGETSSVDDPEMIELQHSTIESLADTHLQEQHRHSFDDRYWEKYYSNWLDHRADEVMAFLSAYDL